MWRRRMPAVSPALPPSSSTEGDTRGPTTSTPSLSRLPARGRGQGWEPGPRRGQRLGPRAKHHHPKGGPAVRLVLHQHPFASYCQKVLVALGELDLPFDSHIVDDADARAEHAARV